jgi:hypothetical protein
MSFARANSMNLDSTPSEELKKPFFTTKRSVSTKNIILILIRKTTRSSKTAKDCRLYSLPKIPIQRKTMFNSKQCLTNNKNIALREVRYLSSSK